MVVKQPVHPNGPKFCFFVFFFFLTKEIIILARNGPKNYSISNYINSESSTSPQM